MQELFEQPEMPEDDEIESSDKAKETLKDLLIKVLTVIAHWFVPVVGLIYACGFLVVFTFFKTFGISGAEFFQAKYIHVGSLFVMSCIVCILPMWWWAVMRDTKKRDPKITGMGQSIIVYGIMLLMFFVAVAFAKKGFFEFNPECLVLICGIPLVFLILDLAGEIIKPEKRPEIINSAKWILVFLEIGVAIYTITTDNLNLKLGRLLWEGKWPKGGTYFIAFMAFIFFYVSAMFSRFKKLEDNTYRRINILVSSLCIVGVFLYLSILTFAYGIYPYIPSIKGGGDYSDACPVTIYYRSNMSEAIPPRVKEFLAAKTESLVLLDVNASSFFFASASDAGGPVKWQRSVTNRPNVFEIRRETIASLVYATNVVQLPAETTEKLAVSSTKQNN